MKEIKKLSVKRILLFLLLPFMILSFMLGILIKDKSVKAWPNTNSTTFSDPIYNYEELHYELDALNKLAKAILGSETLKNYGDNPTIYDLIDFIQEKADMDGRALNNKSITFKYGQFDVYSSSTNKDLVWMPVYMSTTEHAQNEKGDAVLTLYLAANTSSGTLQTMEQASFTEPVTGRANYCSDINCTMPSNMYGSSYLRANALANGGDYISYNNDPTNTSFNRKTQNSKFDIRNKYLEFVRFTNTSDELINGNLWEDIVTPSRLVWQRNENFQDAVIAVANTRADNSVNIDGIDVRSEWQSKNYCWPNEAYVEPKTGSYSMNAFDYGKITEYSAWQNDKVWLPSLSEVGTGDNAGTDDNTNGLWKLTRQQRSNIKTPATAGGPSWLRTANTVDNPEGAGYSTYSMFACNADGDIVTQRLGTTVRLSVRPAIHLNLSMIVNKLSKPVDLPASVSSVYNGEEQYISDEKGFTLPDGKPTWWVDPAQETPNTSRMFVAFFFDAECLQPAAPINAGEYYMRVTLNDAKLYFAKNPSTVRSKVIKFIIAKKVLGVEWIYEDGKAVGIKYAEGTKIYDRDIKMGRSPELGIVYKSDTLNNKDYYDFDELLRGTYHGEAMILNSDIYDFNYDIDKSQSLQNPYNWKSLSFEVGRKKVAIPYFYGYGEGTIKITVPYAGEQYVQVANASKYFVTKVKTTPSGLTYKDVGLTDDGERMTFKVSERGTYEIEISFENNNQFTWEGTDYNFDVTGDLYADSTSKTLTVNVVYATVEVDFVGLPAEWSTLTTIQTFTLDIRGIYNYDPVNDPVNMSVYYTSSANPLPTIITPVNGVYTLSNLPAGEYTLAAGMSDSKYEQNYHMDPSYKTQRFKVIQATSSLSDNDIEWYYMHGGQSSPSYAFMEHNTAAKALEFDYDGDYYIFALTLSETTLHDRYYVKAIYSGDTFVKDAGLHCVTVTLTAFFKNVQFEDKEYKFYFKINQIKLDIECLEWDYDPEEPFAYDASIKHVRLTTDSLALIPGLTAQYSTNGNGRDAGEYVTQVSFVLSASYAVNYILPVADDNDSYDGIFSFTCEWKIEKAQLTVEWDVLESNDNKIVIVPTLKYGKEFVDYIYEHKESNGSWTPAEHLTASGAPETYRVKAVLKPEYENNYELVNNEPCEFSVPSGKTAISLHFEHNGEVVSNGAEIPYTGDEIKLTLAVDGGGMSINEYTFKYYSIGNGGARTELDGAPTEVGSYVATVTVKSGSETYLEETPEVLFNIVKADYDPSQIFWIYEHGDTIIAATYDKDQGKWVDEQGREVIFSFEYDGTQHKLDMVCLQDFTAHPEDAISVKSLAGNTATNASTTYYTAVVEFNYNSEHYNDPTTVFPDMISWQVRKAVINYNEVRWGYIDSNGVERDFDFDNNSFMYTRDESGVIEFTVALIGLPKGIQNLISYTTQSLSVTGSAAQPGNSRAAVGEYLTTFTISGSWSDPNYEEFKAGDFSSTIPKMQTWQIERRPLSKMKYEDGFPKFDDRVHSILELCQIPENQLNYFKLDITFVDSTEKNVDNNYGGYKDEKYMIYHAGTYDVRLYEITLDKDGKDAYVIWDYVRIIVEKNVLYAEWNESGSYPVGVVPNVYATDMVTTKYYNMKGAEVPLAYVKSTSGEEQFYAMICATEAYEKDIDIVVNGEEKKPFTYHPFKPTPSAAQLDVPTFINPRAEYTGEEISFEIKDWVSYFSQYLYIADDINSNGVFKQKEIGEYHIIVRFKKDADAYWKLKSENAIEDYDRDARTLTFYIDPPTKWALDYPNIDNKSVEYTGNYIDFVITNWVALNKYLDYEVFYKGESLGKTLSFRDGGIYTVVFTFPEGSIGYWKDDPDNPKKEYRIQISIWGDPDEPLEILYPTLNKESAEYNGTAQQFRLIDWVTYFSQYLEFELPEGVKFSGGIFTATGIGTYNIIARIKEETGYKFVDGTTEYTITFVITPPQGGSNVEFPLPEPVLDVTEQNYTGNELTFNIVGWASIYSGYVEVTCDNSAVKIEGGTIKVTKAGTYTLIVSFLPGIKAYWEGTDFSRESIPLTITVVGTGTPSTGATKVGKPELGSNTKTYNGKEQVFELLGIKNMDAITITGDKLTQKDVGTYTVTISLKDPSKTTWDDGTTGAIKLTFYITKAKLPSGTHVGVGNNGKPELQDADGNHVDSDFDFGDLFDVEFTDKDGNPVKEEDLVEGGEYNAKLVPHEDKIKNSMEDADNLLKDAKDRNDAGGWDIVYTPDKEGGFNPLWFLIILASVYAVLLIIIVILARRRKRLYGDDEDGEGDDYGDDYGDDEDDDYDYDDDDDY